MLQHLHWLPMTHRCKYKIVTLVFHHFDGSLPPYLSRELITYKAPRTLRSKYADDTEMSKSGLPQDFGAVKHDIQSCISDVLDWMLRNKLKLNTEKTELMPVGAPNRLTLINDVSAVVGESDIPFQPCVHIDQSLPLHNHISSLSHACFFLSCAD